LRILVISHEYPPIGGGGGKVASDLNTIFIKNGHRVSLITSNFFPITNQSIIDGVKVYPIKCNRKQKFKASIQDMLLFIINGFIRSFQIMKIEKPNLIHVHFAVPGGMLAFLISKIWKIPYVLTIHLGDVPGGNPFKTDKWFRYIFPFTKIIWNNAIRIVAVSDFTKVLANRSYKNAIEVIHNGIEITDNFSKLVTVNKAIKIVFAGRFAKQKNLSFLIDILGNLGINEWECTLIGDGDEKRNIEKKISYYGLTSKINFTGWISPQEVLEIFEKSDILLMPSLSEGLPVVGVQALEKGLAIISSDAGGLVEIVEDGYNGYLLNLGNIGEWTTKIELLKNRTKLNEFKVNSREKVKGFDIITIGKSYLDLFEEIILE
jgi:L-malate glycosyltransferase